MKITNDPVLIDAYTGLSCFGFYLIRQALVGYMGDKPGFVNWIIDLNDHRMAIKDVARLAYVFHNLNEGIVSGRGIDEDNLWMGLDDFEMTYPRIRKGDMRRAYESILGNHKISVHELMGMCSR
jgi:hypothetical protein